MRPALSPRRLARGLGAAAVGVLVAGAFALGTSVGTADQAARSQSQEELRLAAYCRHLYGERADAYQPREPEAWRCSAWRNGVWGLEEVDLAAACRWQAGPASKLESTGGSADDSASGAGVQRLTCTE